MRTVEAVQVVELKVDVARKVDTSVKLAEELGPADLVEALKGPENL